MMSSFDGSTAISSKLPVPKDVAFCCTQALPTNLYKPANPENNSPELFAIKGVTQLPFTPPGEETDPELEFPALLLI